MERVHWDTVSVQSTGSAFPKVTIQLIIWRSFCENKKGCCSHCTGTTAGDWNPPRQVRTYGNLLALHCYQKPLKSVTPFWPELRCLLRLLHFSDNSLTHLFCIHSAKSARSSAKCRKAAARASVLCRPRSSPVFGEGGWWWRQRGIVFSGGSKMPGGRLQMYGLQGWKNLFRWSLLLSRDVSQLY